MKKLFLVMPEDILNKEFHIDFKGYDAQEVDSFLDIVKQNTELQLAYIKKLESEINNLRQENGKLKVQRNNDKAKMDIMLNEKQILEQTNSSNADIILRLSKLENELEHSKSLEKNKK